MNAYVYLFVCIILLGVGQAICYVTYLIQLVIAERGGTALVCLLLFCICGTTAGFFHGWSTSDEFDNFPLMAAWTACWLGSVVTGVISSIV